MFSQFIFFLQVIKWYFFKCFLTGGCWLSLTHRTEDYEKVLSESRFQPDYEEPTDNSEGGRSGGLVDVSRLVRDLLERPSAVAASVMSVAKGQTALNQQLGSIVTRLEALELKRDDVVKNAQMKALLGDT